MVGAVHLLEVDDGNPGLARRRDHLADRLHPLVEAGHGRDPGCLEGHAPAVLHVDDDEHRLADDQCPHGLLLLRRRAQLQSRWMARARWRDDGAFAPWSHLGRRCVAKRSSRVSAARTTPTSDPLTMTVAGRGIQLSWWESDSAYIPASRIAMTSPAPRAGGGSRCAARTDAQRTDHVRDRPEPFVHAGGGEHVVVGALDGGARRGMMLVLASTCIQVRPSSRLIDSTEVSRTAALPAM